MKLYRSVEYSKLIWMISNETSLAWYHANMLHEVSPHSSEPNWWLNANLETYRRYIIADICENSNADFFNKSIDYNAMQGGRFNPSKSFGVLYMSSNPLLSALEVLYHQFYSAYPLYKKIDRNSNQFTSSFNVRIPKTLHVLMIAFEIEIADTYCKREICSTDTLLKDDCQLIGFNRYIGDNFTRDFIFGNDYEISRILGSYLHTLDDSSFQVPSARVDFDLQDELNIRNYILPEKNFDPGKVGLTGKYLELKCEIDLDISDNNFHEVKVQIEGKTVALVDFLLQPKPIRNKHKSQFIRYEPTSGNANDKKKFFREVEVQKFFSQQLVKKGED